MAAGTTGYSSAVPADWDRSKMPATTSITVQSAEESWPELRRFAESFAEEHALPDDERFRILIALEELLTNVVKYGYDPGAAAGAIEVSLGMADDVMTLVFADDGRPFDPLAAAPPGLEDSVEARPIGGLGLHMIRAFADSVAYLHEGGRNTLTIARRLHRTP
jgi:anti-sigma regulatory factor (Ser/Thr protein kinase)